MVDQKEVKDCILSVVKKVVADHCKQIKTESGDVGEKFCLQLVSDVSSQLNSEVGNNCPSTEGYKYVVHVTLQERWGQGSLVGGRALWDKANDTVVSQNYDTEQLSLVSSVYFLKMKDEDTEDESEGDGAG